MFSERERKEKSGRERKNLSSQAIAIPKGELKFHPLAGVVGTGHETMAPFASSWQRDTVEAPLLTTKTPSPYVATPPGLFMLKAMLGSVQLVTVPVAASKAHCVDAARVRDVEVGAPGGDAVGVVDVPAPGRG